MDSSLLGLLVGVLSAPARSAGEASKAVQTSVEACTYELPSILRIVGHIQAVHRVPYRDHIMVLFKSLLGMPVLRVYQK